MLADLLIRFADVTRSLLLVAVTSAVLVLFGVSAMTRRRARAGLVTIGGPYRGVMVRGPSPRPARLRAISVTSLAFGHLFAPVLLLATLRYPVDGIVFLFVPGVVVALANWSCAWLLAWQTPAARASMRAVARASVVFGIALLFTALAHVGLGGDPELAIVSAIFALALLGQSAFVLTTAAELELQDGE